MRVTSFDVAYSRLLEQLMRDDAAEEVNERTGVRIKLIEGGYSFKLDLSDGNLPVASNRRYFPHIAAAETAWQFLGTKDPSFMLKHAPKLWSKFVEDGELKTAYGYRWRVAFGRDQLALALNELGNNPTNRQLFVLAWDPRRDGLGGPQPKNIPCPVGFTLSRCKNKIHMSVLLRSSDTFVGLPYDVMAYGLTLSAIAASVGCTPGTMHVTLAHPHLYEPHWAMAEASLDGWLLRGAPQTLIPVDWTVFDIENNPGGYIKFVKEHSDTYNKWNPLPELIE